jgi:hypothetical protein
MTGGHTVWQGTPLNLLRVTLAKKTRPAIATAAVGCRHTVPHVPSVVSGSKPLDLMGRLSGLWSITNQ